MAQPDEPHPPVVPSCPLPSKTCDVVPTERPRSCCGMALAGLRTAKYHLPEWHRRNAGVCFEAYTTGEQAERGRGEAKHLMKHAAASAQRAQGYSKATLGQRLQDLQFWRVELQKEIMELDAETNLLVAQKLRLERALDATEVPYSVVIDNLECRERRQPPDLVIDEVEKQLMKEADLIRDIRDLLKRTIIQAATQIRSNRIQKENCELDWSDKVETYNIDDKCIGYCTDSTDVQFHPSSVKFEENASTPKSWAQFSHDNISRAEQEKLASVQLRSLINNIIHDASEDLRMQRAAVSEAFDSHCRELDDAKLRLESHLKQILKDIGDEEANIENLKKAIRDKEAFLKVAQTRLYDRSSRPNVELCRDEPQFRLVNEVEGLTVFLEALKRKLMESEQNLKNLEETRMKLEKEIAVKANSIFIDRQKCMGYRVRYPVDLEVASYQQ
ncbi:tektin-4 [Ammospiza nelsoni]|uniref:Tektin n=1 Tax=Junco hyemalis TaxID=40217 RepID=A0A8C5IPR7_JUNHY|nr:tektin-4 [Ammospiza caudacuta]XP_059340554.1 tektin-4 [Ammospiza nelsoni]